MDLLSLYPHLEGSHGKIRVRLSPPFLERVCSVLMARMHGRVRHLHILPSGENRFRIKAELSNRFYHHVGSLMLRVFREQGIEVHISQATASRASPTIDGWMDASMIGSKLAVPAMVATLNDVLGAGETFEIKKAKWLGWTSFRVFVAIHPLRLLEAYLPADIGHHVTDVRCHATSEAFLLDLHWRHTGNVTRSHRSASNG